MPEAEICRQAFLALIAEPNLNLRVTAVYVISYDDYAMI